MLIIEEQFDTIYASFEGIKRFTCHFSKDVECELIPFVEDSERELILNMDGITFIDSAAFDTLLTIHNKAKETKSKFQIKNITNDAKELFDLLKLTSVFALSEN